MSLGLSPFMGFLKSESGSSALKKFWSRKSTVLHKVSGVLTYSGVNGCYSDLYDLIIFSLMGWISY